MATEIPTIFLRRLIAIGESQDFSELRQLFAEFPPDSVGHFMRQSPQFWYSIADSLSDLELEALIRALTVAERDFPSFGGGSVSGVIWTFKRLDQRKAGGIDALADWILARTANDYVPFGRSNGGARSLAELDAYRHRVAERRISRQRAEEERHTTAAERKAERATHDIFSAIRRKDTKGVQALLLRGARLDVPDASGVTALAYAQALGHAPILELLQDKANGLQSNA
jgi:hypothetical protein